MDMEEGGLACIQGSISYYNRDLEVIILCFGVTFRNGRRCSEHNSRAHLTLVVDFQLNSFTALLSSCSSGFYFPLCFASLPRDTCTLNEAYDDTLIIHINLFFTSVLLSSHQRKQVGWYGSRVGPKMIQNEANRIRCTLLPCGRKLDMPRVQHRWTGKIFVCPLAEPVLRSATCPQSQLEPPSPSRRTPHKHKDPRPQPQATATLNHIIWCMNSTSYLMLMSIQSSQTAENSTIMATLTRRKMGCLPIMTFKSSSSPSWILLAAAAAALLPIFSSCNAFMTTTPTPRSSYAPSIVASGRIKILTKPSSLSSLLFSSPSSSSSSNASASAAASASVTSNNSGDGPEDLLSSSTITANWDKVSNEWELDCYSRPVLVDGKKKLWEVLVTDSTGNMRICRSLPSNK